jgi:hypothetical protein
VSLPQNNQIVIYEMPVKWMSSDPAENAPLVELGTFDKVIFEHLDDLGRMGVNCIELLPIEDSPQTLNWGYGTRFFFAPDYDIGTPVDAKFFVKTCHQRGIRVVLDVVMNMFAPKCPLAVLATPWFYEPGSSGRQDWDQDLFSFDTPSYDNYFARTSHPALQRNEVQLFYFHPQFDDDDSPRVFAYCRTGGQPLGTAGQVIVIVNMGPQSFPTYIIPGWRWGGSNLTEIGYPRTGPVYNPMTGSLSLSLNSFEGRVFTT